MNNTNFSWKKPLPDRFKQGSKEYENIHNPLAYYITQPGEELILSALTEQKEQASRHYILLQRLALYLNNESCTLIKWGNNAHIYENGIDSFMIIADFIIKQTPADNFLLYYQHEENALTLDSNATPLAILYWLNRMASANKQRYLIKKDTRQNLSNTAELPF